MSKVEKEEVVVVLEKKKKVVTNSMTWTTEQPPQRVRQGPQNIKNPAGVKPEYREKIEPLDAWSVFFNDGMIQMIVTWTNQSIRASPHANSQHLIKMLPICMKPMKEMKAFIGYGTCVDC